MRRLVTFDNTWTRRAASVAAAAMVIGALAWVVSVGVALPNDPEDPTARSPIEWLPEAVPVPDSEAATEAEMKGYTDAIPGTDVTFDMVPIPAGTFTLGSPEDEPGREACEGPQSEVAIAPFWMGKCEVTWDEYDLWGMGTDQVRRKGRGVEPTPWDTLADAITIPTKPYLDMSFGMGREGHPAICMTQLAAKVYCKYLSAKTGRYYRLPTEAEWEYACRAGTTTAYSFGDDPAQLDAYAWTFENSDDSTHPVGEKEPNAWGLHDMHGNVCEWTLDKFTPEGYEIEAGAEQDNPVVIPEKLYPRVARGGTFMDDPELVRSASRRGSGPTWKQSDPQFPQSPWYHTDAYYLGFRIVRPLTPPESAEEAAKYDLDAKQLKDYQDYPHDRGHQ